MLAKLLSWKAVGVALLTATAVWASVGPDSLLQNSIGDDLRAWKAKGRWVELSDSQPLGNRYPVVLVLGMNGSGEIDGPSEDDFRRMTNSLLSNCQAIYLEECGKELYNQTKWYGYWYNSGFGDSNIAGWLDAKIENDPDLTKAGQKLSLVCHSKGGNVAYCYWVRTSGRKVDRVITLSTPHLGSSLVDKAKVKKAVQKLFPYFHKVWWKFLEPRLPPDSEGTRWLRTDCAEMRDLHSKHSLTKDWLLVGSKIPSLSQSLMGRNIGIAFLASSKLPFGANQDRPVYTLGARLIEDLVYEGSDGMVPLSSAWCEGYAGDASTLLVANHDHAEMLQGNGSLEVHRAVIDWLFPRILQKTEPKIGRFDLWLPDVPVTNIPQTQADGLDQARLAWINEDGGISVADSQFANPRKLYLPEGLYSWPQWMDDKLLATWNHAGGSDIVLISGNKVVQLTRNGKSSLSSVGEGLIVFVSDGDLVLRTNGGLSRVLVRGPISVQYPPVVLGGKVYFSTTNSSGGDLRWVSLEANGCSLTKTRLVDTRTLCPIKIGSVLLAIRAEADQSTVSVVTGQWGTLRMSLMAGTKALNEVLSDGQIPMPTLVGMDSQESWLYLAIGGDIRQLDLAEIVSAIARGDESIDFDRAAIWRAKGTQFDVK